MLEMKRVNQCEKNGWWLQALIYEIYTECLEMWQSLLLEKVLMRHLVAWLS